MYPPGWDGDTDWPPNQPGWIRIIDTSNKLSEAIVYQFDYSMSAIKFSAEIIYAEYPDPDLNNNLIEIKVPIKTK